MLRQVSGAPAKDEKSARHDSMPRSAAAEGLVDFVLPPREIAWQLGRIAGHSYAREAGAGGAPPVREDVLAQILNVLRSATGVDFTHYKRSTVCRRIERRIRPAPSRNHLITQPVPTINEAIWRGVNGRSMRMGVPASACSA